MKRPKIVFIVVLFLIVVTGGILAWRYFDKKPQPAAETALTTVAGQKHDDRIGNPSQGAEFDLVLDEMKLVKGPSRITVDRGVSVKINIIAGGHEEAGALLEGYGITTEADPQAPGAFSFIADTPGTFNFYALDEHSRPNLDDIPEKHFLGTLTVK